MLGAVLVSAVELLSSSRRDRIRTCGADDCLWLFLDTSKNGHRTKARRFYQRKREATER